MIRSTYGLQTRTAMKRCTNALLHIDKYEYKEIVRPMFNEALVVQKKLDIENTESMLTDKEVKNFVHYPEIARERDRLNEHLEPNDKKTNTISFYQ